jgi:hypothetical protein
MRYALFPTEILTAPLGKRKLQMGHTIILQFISKDNKLLLEWRIINEPHADIFQI